MIWNPCNYRGGGISNSKTITEKGKYALDARENNPDLPDTLAHDLAHKLDIVDGAAAHNGRPRGIDLMTIMDKDEMFGRIADGSFKDEWIGDYFDITIHTEYTPTEIVRCMMGMFDPFLHSGKISLERHHALIVPKNCFAKTHQMNPTNTTVGGYKGATINTVLDKYANAIADAIGSSHMIQHNSLLTNAISETSASMAGAGFAGCSSSWTWHDVRLQLLSEIQVCGSNVCSSSFYDTGCDNFQLPLFALDPTAKVCGKNTTTDGNGDGDRQWYWLRNVASASDFAIVVAEGNSYCNNASNSYGVRPFFLIG